MSEHNLHERAAQMQRLALDLRLASGDPRAMAKASAAVRQFREDRLRQGIAELEASLTEPPD